MKLKYITLVILAWCLSFESAISQEIYEPNKKAAKDIQIELKDGAEPDVYIDGIKYDPAIIKLIDPNKIKTINVVKGEKALEEYNAPNGVILITSINSDQKVKYSDTELKIRRKDESDPNATSTIKIRGGDENPLVIIDGKVSTKEKLNDLKPEDIEKIDVLKGDKAMEEYKSNTGVILITTKKNE